MVLSADAPPDPADPRLGQHAVGERLDAFTAEVQRFRDEGLRLAAAAAPTGVQSVTVVSVDGDSAEVRECFVDDALVLDRATGAVVNDDLVTLSSRATVRRVDGVWKVAEVVVLQSWEGVAGCALAG